MDLSNAQSESLPVPARPHSVSLAVASLILGVLSVVFCVIGFVGVLGINGLAPGLGTSRPKP